MDERAFREWIESYTADIYRYFRYNLGLTEDTSQELAHKTFVEAWASMDSFAQRSGVKSWLMGIARNVGRKYFRHKQRKQIGAELAQQLHNESAWRASEAQNPEELLQAKRNQARLAEVIASLSAKKQEIFNLRYMQQMTIDELVTLLEEPRETLRSRLRAARQEVKLGWMEKTRKK